MAGNPPRTKIDKTVDRVLLPSHVTPTMYEIHLKPDMVNFTFDSVAHITMTTTASGNIFQDYGGDNLDRKIILHARDLSFTKAAYRIVDDERLERTAKYDEALAPSVEAEEIHVNLKETTVTFVFPGSIPCASTIVLQIHYMGALNNQMAGFYRSHYKDHQGNSKIVASTQFEALDARRAFPCADEPSVKATFIVSLTVPSHLECFSNMPESSRATVVEDGIGDGDNSSLVKITFLETPKMSTYLLAFCVGEFDYVQTQSDHGVLIKVYAPRGRSESGRFALQCAKRCLDAYDDFFGIPYPLPKLDMVAIPEFAMGAMENWGLITYRDVDLLIDLLTASNKQKQRVCSVVCHELAHQWFGNLVTMAWWDDLWLNEAFASWAENWSANLLFPYYRMWDQFVTDHLSRALKLDGLLSSHPIQVPISHAEEVEQVFDAISYCKGASVVRMICGVLGFETFQAGLTQYMNDHAYGNTETYDLWRAWENASDLPVQELMACWTEQMGFPMVKVISEDWQDNRVVLTCEQSWFLSDGSAPPDTNKLWMIPILTCTATGTQGEVTMMREKTATVTIPYTSKGSSDWVKLNAGQEVPMRVLYSNNMLSRLWSHAIPAKSLPVSDRVGLILDSFAFVKAGAMNPEDLIKLLASYVGEDSCVVWQGLSDVLNGLHSILQDEDIMCERFVQFARHLIMPLVDLIGWDDKNLNRPSGFSSADADDHLRPILRGIMISLLSTFCYDDLEVQKEARTRCQKFLADPVSNASSLSTDIKPSVFRIFLKSGAKAEYDAVKNYYNRAKDNAERKHVLNTLGSTPDASLKLATMEWSTSGEIKVQDFFYAMGSVGQSGKTGRDVAWGYFKDTFGLIKSMLSEASPSLMSAVIVNCAGGYASISKADEIEAFFEENPLPKNTQRIAQLTENMRVNGSFLTTLQSSALADEEFWKSLKFADK